MKQEDGRCAWIMEVNSQRATLIRATPCGLPLQDLVPVAEPSRYKAPRPHEVFALTTSGHGLADPCADLP